MNKKIKKLLLIFSMFLISITICGCNNNDDNNKLIINSHKSGKLMPYTIIEIEMKSEYLLEENYEIVVKYGHLLTIFNNEDYEDEDTTTLFQIRYYEDEHKLGLTVEELFSGHILFEVENFLTEEYNTFYSIINGKKTYTFPKELTINIPKEILIGNYGLISLSLTDYSYEGIPPYLSMTGSFIYLKYNIKGDKIYFKKN